MNILRELPTDLQHVILEKYEQRIASGKRYVVECCIGIYGYVNWQGASAWHNDDPGEDDFYYKIHPIFQLVYNQDTDTWHRPGKILQASLPEEGDFIQRNTTTSVGNNILHKKTVVSMMRRKMNNIHTKMDMLYAHNEEGQRRYDKNRESHTYTETWHNEQEVMLRVREIVDAPPSNKKDIWERRDPTQLAYGCLFDRKYTPYDFYTKHIFTKDIYPNNAQYVWKCVRECLETKGDFSTLDVEDKEPDVSEWIL